MLLPYIIALVTLLIYWYFHAEGDKGASGMVDWLKKNKLTAIVQVAVMFAIITLRDLVLPYLAIPFAMAASAALLSGTAIDKLVKMWEWLVGQLKGIDESEEDLD